jgi:hypothetical protein
MLPGRPPCLWVVQAHKQLNEIRPPTDRGVWRVTSVPNPIYSRTNVGSALRTVHTTANSVPC